MIKISCPILDLLNGMAFHFSCLHLFCDNSKAITNIHDLSDPRENSHSLSALRSSLCVQSLLLYLFSDSAVLHRVRAWLSFTIQIHIQHFIYEAVPSWGGQWADEKAGSQTSVLISKKLLFPKVRCCHCLVVTILLTTSLPAHDGYSQMDVW